MKCEWKDYLLCIWQDCQPMHANDSICFGLGMGDFCSGEMHAVQGHGAGKDHDAAGLVGDGEIVAQMAP